LTPDFNAGRSSNDAPSSERHRGQLADPIRITSRKTSVEGVAAAPTAKPAAAGNEAMGANDAAASFRGERNRRVICGTVCASVVTQRIKFVHTKSPLRCRDKDCRDPDAKTGCAMTMRPLKLELAKPVADFLEPGAEFLPGVTQRQVNPPIVLEVGTVIAGMKKPPAGGRWIAGLGVSDSRAALNEKGRQRWQPALLRVAEGAGAGRQAAPNSHGAVEVSGNNG
jgi:hypothetical protein